MMTFPVWIDGVLGVVDNIQDLEYQKRVWLRGEGPEVSTFGDTVCNFFDDYDADGLLARSPKESGLTELQYTKLKEFRDVLNEYSDKIFAAKSSDAFILADPRWDEIRALAQQVLDAFKK